MFIDKNSIKKDMVDFVNDNKLIRGEYSFNDAMTYAALVESRIQNNFVLLNNPTLCSRYGINPEDLYAELDSLMEIRQKISFCGRDNKKMR